MDEKVVEGSFAANGSAESECIELYRNTRCLLDPSIQ